MDCHEVWGIGRVNKNLPLLLIPMTYTKLYFKNTVQHSVNVGAPNLSLVAKAQKSKVALIAVPCHLPEVRFYLYSCLALSSQH